VVGMTSKLMSLYNRVLKGLLAFSLFVVTCSLFVVSYALLTGPPPGVAHYEITDIHREDVVNRSVNIESETRCKLDGEVVNCSEIPSKFNDSLGGDGE